MVLLPIHIIGGLLGIVSGFVAVFAGKGGSLHRKSGLLFVYAMLVLSATGTLIAVTRNQPFNVVAGLLTAYLVISGLLAVRRPAAGARWMDLGAMVAALAVGVTCVVFIGIDTFGSARGSTGERYTVIYYIFGTGAFLAAFGDVRTLLARRVPQQQRLARHLRRMCFALMIAAGSFFIGQAKVFPEPVRSSGLLALPVLLVVALLVFWLIRISYTKWRPRYSQPAAMQHV
jgi:hypothetical protein